MSMLTLTKQMILNCNTKLAVKRMFSLVPGYADWLITIGHSDLGDSLIIN